MQYIEAPNYVQPNSIKDWSKTIFLGGSITGAESWQDYATETLLPHFDVFNPRRAEFDISNKNAEREQITWEHHYLDSCQINLFYFSYETLAPITLLELGATLESVKLQHYKKVYIAIHPDYKRKNDVIIQTELRNKQFSKNITFSLGDTLNQIIKENK